MNEIREIGPGNKLCNVCEQDNRLRISRGDEAILKAQCTFGCCLERRFKELEDEVFKLKLRIEKCEPWK